MSDNVDKLVTADDDNEWREFLDGEKLIEHSSTAEFLNEPEVIQTGEWEDAPITSWQKFLAGDRFIEPSSLAKFKKELEA